MPSTSNGSRTGLARLLVALAVGLAANSILGPLVLDVIDYRYSDSLVNQGIGLDAVALLGAAPIAIVAAALVHGRHPAGPLVAFVPATFAAYMTPQYVIGPDYLGLPGNNERFFVFHLALFVTALATVVTAWRSVDRGRLRPDTEAGDRRRSLVLIGVAAFILLGRWLAGVVDLLGGDPTGTDYRENPTAYLLIGLLDLGVVVPASIATAVGLRRHIRWARVASYAVIGWFTLVPASVAAMAVVMQLNDDPNATTGATLLFVIAAGVFTTGAALLYRPMFDTAARPRVAPTSADRDGPGRNDTHVSQGAAP